MEIISIQSSVVNINRFHNKNVSRLNRERQSKKGCPIELKLLMIQNIIEVKSRGPRWKKLKWKCLSFIIPDIEWSEFLCWFLEEMAEKGSTWNLPQIPPLQSMKFSRSWNGFTRWIKIIPKQQNKSENSKENFCLSPQMEWNLFG